MDLGKHFEQSFGLLKKNKVILQPIILLVIINVLLSGIWIYYSGYSQMYTLTGNQYSMIFGAVNDLIQGKTNNFYQLDAQQKEIDAKQGQIMMQIFTNPYVLLLGVFVWLVQIAAVVFLGSLNHSMIASGIKVQKVSWQACKQFAFKKIWSFVGASILLCLIFFAAVFAFVVLLALIILLFFTGNTILILLGVLLSFLSILAIIFTSIFLGERLMFVFPAIFLEDANAVASISRSWSMAKKAGWHGWGVYGVYLGISIFLGNTVNSLSSGVFFTVFTSPIILVPIMALIYIILQSVVAAIILFSTIFVYSSYKEIIKMR